MHTVWRLLNTAQDCGAANMAVDEAILRAVQAGTVPPTLRLYGWTPACLSLGHAQPAAEVDWEACRRLGVDVVRRSSGGRAILHVDELTYSLAAPDSEPRVAGDIVSSYRKISAGLLAGLRLLNVPGLESKPQASSTHRALPASPVCFQAPSHYEITVGGKKLAGSAQMRKRAVLLQHGAIPLCGDIARICRLLLPRPEEAALRARATTVEATLGRAPSFDEAAAALVIGFSHALNVELVAGQLTLQEQLWAAELRRDKYGCDEWTKRR
ncbi:MAG: lipoate--protein ligase family protein [Thermoflexales bacterium]|nr:lipoate--protein ligase family protein [Thermoflexales bacterium]